MQSHSTGLNSSQHEYINASIEHFFIDLPNNPAEFKKVVEEFRGAFLNKLKSDSALFYFQNCIHKSAEYLRSVALVRNPVTVGQVQQYLFNRTGRILKRLAKERKLEILWRTDLFSEVKEQKTFQQEFKAQSMSIDSDTITGGLMEGELKVPQDAIYRARILTPVESKIEDPFRIVEQYMRLQIDVELKTPQSHTDEKFKRQPYIRNDEEQAKFYRDITPAALVRAEEIAIAMVLKSLELKKEDMSAGCAKLLVYRYFYDAYLEGQFDLKTKISLMQAEILTDPDIIFLLQKKKLLLNKVLSSWLVKKNLSNQDALELWRAQKIVITVRYFFGKILSGECSADKLYQLKRHQCRNLSFPSMQNLLQNEDISLQDAIGMSSGAGMLIQHDNYRKLAIENRSFFRLIQKIDMKRAEELLRDSVMKDVLNPVILKALLAERINFDDVIYKTKSFYECKNAENNISGAKRKQSGEEPSNKRLKTSPQFFTPTNTSQSSHSMQVESKSEPRRFVTAKRRS